MFDKDWDKRWRETVNYLNGATATGQVGAEIEHLLPTDSTGRPEGRRSK